MAMLCYKFMVFHTNICSFHFGILISNSGLGFTVNWIFDDVFLSMTKELQKSCKYDVVEVKPVARILLAYLNCN